jgi:hypothetical protein
MNEYLFKFVCDLLLVKRLNNVCQQMCYVQPPHIVKLNMISKFYTASTALLCFGIISESLVFNNKNILQSVVGEKTDECLSTNVLHTTAPSQQVLCCWLALVDVMNGVHPGLYASSVSSDWCTVMVWPKCHLTLPNSDHLIVSKGCGPWLPSCTQIHTSSAELILFPVVDSFNWGSWEYVQHMYYFATTDNSSQPLALVCQTKKCSCNRPRQVWHISQYIFNTNCDMYTVFCYDNVKI